MKKLISLMLILVMVCCMSATAFAAGEDTTTVTLNTPATTPDYILHVPDTVALNYTTDRQAFGTISVTEVKDSVDAIYVYPKYEMLKNTAAAADTIDWRLSNSVLGVIDPLTGLDTEINNPVQVYWKGQNSYDWTNGYRTTTLEAQITDLSTATPNATYRAVVTYSVLVE